MPNHTNERTHRLITKGLPLDLLPTEQDLQRVDTMTPCQCPRRYCWWWRTLSLDWDTSIAQGCAFDQTKHPTFGDPSHPPQDIPPCNRLDATSPLDHYEPRDPALLEDGLTPARWICKK
ncbi:hypothetical protein COB72_04230 [bacterium]|nr:MAG: hypothetical protein COB72_04230 [bacterium]